MRYYRRTSKSIDTEAVSQVAESIGCSAIMAQLLLQRGISTESECEAFVSCSKPRNDDPFLLSDMHLAVDTIMQAINAGKRICIYGDYDVDGVCATVILYRALTRYTSNVLWYIPSRHSEGYGMHAESIRKLAADGVQLIITVDNGISAIAEVEEANNCGMEVIITDHHRFSKDLPKAKAVVASSRNEYAEEVNDLSGAGIAWMLSRALTHEQLFEFLPYVALAIAADAVNVTRLNRYYLKKAFAIFKNDAHFTLLLQNAGSSTAEISMYALNYIIAPRINAAGRMAHADIAIQFFLSNDLSEMAGLADTLEGLNQKRKDEELRIYTECLKQSGSDSHVLVFFGEDWNTGVVGIVASRLVELFHKNVFVLGKSDTGDYIGSGRSDSNTDLYKLLLPCSDTLVHFGGHAGAAGITVSKKNLSLFIEKINSSYNIMFPDGPSPQRIEYDIEIRTDECSTEIANEIQLLSPFGTGNPEPVFRFSNVLVSRAAVIGKNREHLSANILSVPSNFPQNPLRILAFKHGSEIEKWNGLEHADFLATLSVNSFRGTETCEAKFVAFNSSILTSETDDFIELVNAFFVNLRYNNIESEKLAKKINAHLKPQGLTEARLRDLYRQLKCRYHGCSGIKCCSNGTSEEIAALLIFFELGLVSLDGSNVIFKRTDSKTDCRKSILYITFNKL